ncbi:LysM domain-containing protein [Nocardioides terrae]|uniref:LysM domain-containing protein n=1 Tax=Nocardioides terrae TaxID=574651 RepID=A0A1I1DL86_9ACTN|nr:LysM domain-containing protein [Nocardioides terrae]SFB75122.1 LysM domain-containing protein [Nocardioides terrae]
MRLLRCCLLLLAATTAAAGALRVLATSVVEPGEGFEGALVRGCAVVASGCVAWGWLSVVAVIVEALRATGTAGRRPAATPGVPPALRRLVLAGCGVAFTAAAAPALASTGAGTSTSSDAQRAMPAAVAGLPFPARAMDLPAEARHVVVVRPGDSLWAITARHAPQADDAEVGSGWRRLYARNRAVVGDDPSLIHPGQHLVLPDDLEEPR